MKGCGTKGYNAGTGDETGYDFLDAYPSLLIAGADYVLGSKDESWPRANYSGLQAWASKTLESDRDEDGLLEYPQTPQSGRGPGTIRPTGGILSGSRTGALTRTPSLIVPVSIWPRSPA
jgi:hypothetical protein